MQDQDTVYNRQFQKLSVWYYQNTGLVELQRHDQQITFHVEADFYNESDYPTNNNFRCDLVENGRVFISDIGRVDVPEEEYQLLNTFLMRARSQRL